MCGEDTAIPPPTVVSIGAAVRAYAYIVGFVFLCFAGR